MLTRPRMLAFDIDGTLLRDDGSISQRVLEGIHNAREYGFLLMAATGRPWLATRDVIAELGGMSYAACINGAMLLDAQSDQLLHTHSMSVQQAYETAQLARRLLPGVSLAADLADGRHIWDHEFSAQVPPFMLPSSVPSSSMPSSSMLDQMGSNQMGPVIERVSNAEDVVKDTGVEVLAWLLELSDGPNAGTVDAGPVGTGAVDAGQVIATLAPQLDPALAVRHSGLGPAEVTLAGVNKASALEWVANGYGISSSEVMAFGDGLNDIEMLAWAGQSFAMANARPEVRNYAKFTALANESDGVAVVLEELLASV